MAGGRPLLFKTKEELEAKIQAYFDSCFEEEWKEEQARDPQTGEPLFYDVPGRVGRAIYNYIKIKKQVKPMSVTGLAVFLDTSRETLLNYEKKEEFFDTIAKAKDIIENYVEDGMLLGKISPQAATFILKNNWKSWKDQIHNTVELPELSDEEKVKMDKLLLRKPQAQEAIAEKVVEEVCKFILVKADGINTEQCNNPLPCKLHNINEPNQPGSITETNNGNTGAENLPNG